MLLAEHILAFCAPILSEFRRFPAGFLRESPAVAYRFGKELVRQAPDAIERKSGAVKILVRGKL